MPRMRIERHSDGVRRVRIGNALVGSLPSTRATTPPTPSTVPLSASRVDVPFRSSVSGILTLFTSYSALSAHSAYDPDAAGNARREMDERLAHSIAHAFNPYAVSPSLQKSARLIADRILSETKRDPEKLFPDMVERAEWVSYAAHAGQIDKVGLPYYQHPRGVSAYLPTLPEYHDLTMDERRDAVVACYLHDVLEDTNVTLDDLRTMKFSEESLKAVEAVTSRKNEPKEDYYQRVMDAGRVARTVKLADLGHNTMPARRAQLPGSPGHPVAPGEDNMFERLGRKYVKAHRCLGAALPEHLNVFA